MAFVSIVLILHPKFLSPGYYIFVFSLLLLFSCLSLGPFYFHLSAVLILFYYITFFVVVPLKASTCVIVLFPVFL